jgi:hypothetical protein
MLTVLTHDSLTGRSQCTGIGTQPPLPQCALVRCCMRKHSGEPELPRALVCGSGLGFRV